MPCKYVTHIVKTVDTLGPCCVPNMEIVDFFEANKVMVASSTNEVFGIYGFLRLDYEVRQVSQTG